jgi:hypothetical protein
MPSRDQSDYTRRLKYKAIVIGGGQGDIRNRYTDTSSVVVMGNVAGRAFTAPSATVPDEPNIPTVRVLKFTSVGSTSWTAPAGVTSVEYLVVGGGGGGGNGYDTGGGGGGGNGGSGIVVLRYTA